MDKPFKRHVIHHWNRQSIFEKMFQTWQYSDPWRNNNHCLIFAWLLWLCLPFKTFQPRNIRTWSLLLHILWTLDPFNDWKISPFRLSIKQKQNWLCKFTLIFSRLQSCDEIQIRQVVQRLELSMQLSFLFYFW